MLCCRGWHGGNKEKEWIFGATTHMVPVLDDPEAKQKPNKQNVGQDHDVCRALSWDKEWKEIRHNNWGCFLTFEPKREHSQHEWPKKKYLLVLQHYYWKEQARTPQRRSSSKRSQQTQEGQTGKTSLLILPSLFVYELVSSLLVDAWGRLWWKSGNGNGFSFSYDRNVSCIPGCCSRDIETTSHWRMRKIP